MFLLGLLVGIVIGVIGTVVVIGVLFKVPPFFN